MRDTRDGGLARHRVPKSSIILALLCYNVFMDSLEYLNQISKSNRPVKKSSGDVSKTTIIKIAAGGIVLFVLIIAFGSLLGNLSSKVGNTTKQLYSRTDQINSTLRTYNKSLKSSRLRAIGSSLQTVLTGASNQLKDYYSNKGTKSEDLKLTGKTAEEEESLVSNLNLSLENAKLNGILDRTYDNQINLQVSLLLSLTSQVISRTKDKKLLEIVEPLHSSLMTIHENLEAYSNPGD